LAAKKFGEFLDALGCDWKNDPNSKETPTRVAKAYVNDLWAGRYNALPKITTFPNLEYDGMIFQGNIPLISMCSHHHQTIMGRVHVAYIPKINQEIIGLSKINRIVEHYGRRGAIQENLTVRIHDSINSIIKSNKTIQLYRTQNLNKHIITLHDKFSLGFACIILFFIGAPLGTIINKGGYGLPLVISILLFLAYHFLGIFSKNLAEDGSISPILSSWLSTIIMLPISIYLTHRATNDGSSNKLYSFFINLYKPNK